MKIEPLKQEAINELEFLLNGIKSGELKHDQRYFHCGTAHCLAGRYQVLKYEKEGIKEIVYG